MDEKRKFNRWHIKDDKTTVVACEGNQQEVALIDVSAGGMKVNFPIPVNTGSIIYGKLDVLSEIRPFFVKGKVVRVEPKDSQFETAIEFEHVSTTPLGN